jgi:hypothetical protein
MKLQLFGMFFLVCLVVFDTSVSSSACTIEILFPEETRATKMKFASACC